MNKINTDKLEELEDMIAEEEAKMPRMTMELLDDLEKEIIEQV